MTARRSVLVILVLLAVLAFAALGVAADEEHGDWEVIHREVRTGETITVSGQLVVDLNGQLTLRSCTMRFLGGYPGDLRVHVRNGGILLDGTTVEMEGGGNIWVDGRLDIRGETIIKHANILVRGQGTISCRSADLVLEGSYSTPDVNDPVDLVIEGTGAFSGTDVGLVYAFVTSRGALSFTDSSLQASRDFNQEYEGRAERLRLEEGTATLSGSTFSDLHHGILVRADLIATGCSFNASDLRLYAPWWSPGLDGEVSDCAFRASDLVVEVQYHGSENKAMDVLVESITLVGGTVILDINETYQGDILLADVSVTDFTGYGLVLSARGVYGTLRLEDLDIDGPRGVQVKGDFSGLEISNSTIRAQRAAMDFTGTSAVIQASISNVQLFGEDGIVARYAALSVTASDLSGTTVPVRGEGGSSVTLMDCSLDEGAIQLSVAPGQRVARVWVDRHLDIGSVRWTTDDAIAEGVVWFYIFNEDLQYPLPPKPWSVGSAERPLIRILEMSMDDTGEGDYLAFNEVEPTIVLEGTTFEAREHLDPWQDGPFDLVFVDDVMPWARVDPGVSLYVTRPTIEIWGTCGDVGTGIAELGWTLSSSSGEEMGSGTVDQLADGRWRATVVLGANLQTVTLVPVDRAGNYDELPMRPITVDVPAPLLMVSAPENGMVTRDSQVTIAGSVDWYGDSVEVQVVGTQHVTVVPVEGNHFSTVFTLQQQGLNQILITSFDPFEGTDAKLISVHLDTIAPALWLDGLDEVGMNYVANPYLVIVGRTDDQRARITIDGQEVGIIGDKSFASTVRLAEGPQTVMVEATDAAGNVNTVDLRVTLDTVPPLITLVSPDRNPDWTNAEQMSVRLAVDGSVDRLVLGSKVLTVADGAVVHTVTLKEGRNQLDFVAFDRAGNTAALSLVLFLDEEVPDLNIVSPRPGGLVNTTAVPLVVVTSEVGCTLSSDVGNVDATEVSNGRLVGTVYLGPGEGPRELTLVITDLAGNTRSQALEVTVDTVKPSAELAGFYKGKRVTTEPLKVVGRTEPNSKVVWVNDRMAALAPDGEFTTTIELEEGWQTIRVKVIDRAGNEGLYEVDVKVLGSPEFEVPVEALAAGTILLTLTALAVSTEAGKYATLSLLLPLYTKLRKERILDQRTRGLIQGYVTANPGANYTIIRDNLDLADGTLTYHLQVLEREGFLYSIREGLFRCFYPQGVPPPRRGKLHLSDTQADIVRIVKRIPGITVGEIATAMNRRPNVISYHLKLLREGGLIRMEEDGRHVRIYAVDTAVAMI